MIASIQILHCALDALTPAFHSAPAFAEGDDHAEFSMLRSRGDRVSSHQRVVVSIDRPFDFSRMLSGPAESRGSDS
jgi:hypothetical protein